MALSKEEKIKLIKKANELELLYARFLNIMGIRKQVIEKLKEVCTEEFVNNEIIPTYNKKLRNGEYTLDNSQFPVPIKTADFTLNEDSSVSFLQHIFITWSGGQIDDFEVEHTYYFKDGKIDREEPGEKIRRKSK